MEEDKKLILENAGSLQGKVWDIAREIGNNPEEGYQEYFAQELLTGFLQEYGF
ncbi:MAG: M20 family metallopeptidase, partial [Syntrophomonadaceae bacterium]|nr:M20 family metallopeptidase [Syntrophomonadaceae bacterium]